MANPKHVEWLKEGVEAWNERRRNEPFVPKLENAYFEGVYLEGVNLQGAYLAMAHLRGAHLTRANLLEADLFGADLGGAQLQMAVLQETNLRGVDLRGANLHQAHLEEAYLRGVDFEGANLYGALLQGSYLQEANLEGANLEGAICETILYPALELNEVFSAKYTDLIDVIGLKQHQLDAMRGDSGTIIPEHLTRPDHWPVLDIHKDDHPSNYETTDEDEQLKPQPLLNITPPAEFKTVGEFPDVKHYPVRPTSRTSPRNAEKIQSDNEALATIDVVASSLCTMLEKYEREAEAGGNRVGIAEQILSATRDLQKAIGREEKLPTLIQVYARVLKAISIGEDIEAMLDPEKAMLIELVVLVEKYVKEDNLLREINDPAIADKVPDISADEMDDVAGQLEDFATSDAASEHLTDEAIELLTSETQQPVSEDEIERKTWFARIVVLFDKLKQTMAPYASKAKEYIKTTAGLIEKGQGFINKLHSLIKSSKMLDDIWNFIKTIFSSTPD